MNKQDTPAANTQDLTGSKKVSKPTLQSDKPKPKEINGPKGLEPTRYGDWESKGRCHDF